MGMKIPRKGNPHRLTENQLRFCEEYMVDHNGDQAAVRAGLSKASSVAMRERQNVQLHLEDLRAAQSARTEVTADRVLQEYARIGFGRVDQVCSWDKFGNLTTKASDDMSESDLAAIATVQVVPSEFGNAIKVTMHPKKPALDKLSDHLGICGKTSRTELTGEGGGPIAFQTLDTASLKRAANLVLLEKDRVDEAEEANG